MIIILSIIIVYSVYFVLITAQNRQMTSNLIYSNFSHLCTLIINYNNLIYTCLRKLKKATPFLKNSKCINTTVTQVVHS